MRQPIVDERDLFKNQNPVCHHRLVFSNLVFMCAALGELRGMIPSGLFSSPAILFFFFFFFFFILFIHLAFLLFSFCSRILPQNCFVSFIFSCPCFFPSTSRWNFLSLFLKILFVSYFLTLSQYFFSRLSFANIFFISFIELYCQCCQVLSFFDYFIPCIFFLL